MNGIKQPLVSPGKVVKFVEAKPEDKFVFALFLYLREQIY